MKQAKPSICFFLLSILYSAGLLISSSALAMGDEKCMECHNDSDLTTKRDGKEINLFVDYDTFKATVHADEGCVSCHEEAEVQEGDEHPTTMPAVKCGNCHEEVFETYAKSMHGKTPMEGDDMLIPTCYHCHSKHAVLPSSNEGSTTYPLNIPTTCGACHSKEGNGSIERSPRHRDIVENYSMSIHGRGLIEDGLIVTATCVSCHNAHDIQRADNPNSSVNRNNISETCNRCHVGIVNKFKLSVHSPNVTKTDKTLPVCIDCHNSHQINQVVDKGFRQNIVSRCSGCHTYEAKTYFETFHGRAGILLGGEKSAFCSDCHGAHDIYHSSDPKSKMHGGNIVTTCSKCHPKATKNFTEYLTHANHHDKEKYPVLFYSFWGMTGLLVVSFGFFGLHTLLSIPRSTIEYFQLRRKKKKNQIN